MKYNSNNPLSEEELNKLGEEDFDSFLEYLDSKAEYLKKFTKPLNTHQLKKYASIDASIKGESLNDEDLKKLNKLGKKNEEIGFDKEEYLNKVKKKHDVFKSTGIKNVKTHRSQWFD
jgi:hypothetical protein